MNTIQDLFLLGMKRDIPPLLELPHGLGTTVLNLGAGNQVIPGAIALDYMRGWDGDTMPIPYPPGSVDAIHCYHFLEHLQDPGAMLMECQRVLRVGGVLQLCVPYYRGQIAYSELDHKHFFAETTWRKLMANPYSDKFGRNEKWLLRLHANFVMFVEEANPALFAQFERVEFSPWL